MSVELEVVCPAVDIDQVARLVGPLMSTVLHRPVVWAHLENNGGLYWFLRWDDTYVGVHAWPPGIGEWDALWEWTGQWVVTVELVNRVNVSLLLMYMTTIAVAILGDGLIIDETLQLTGGREVQVGDLMTRAAQHHPECSPKTVLAALGCDYWKDE